MKFGSGGGFTASTTPTATAVGEMITQEETLLEAELSDIYAIPLTSTMGISLMKRMATLMVKARILETTNVRTGNQKVDQGDSPKALRDQVTDPDNGLLIKLKTRKINLPDETAADSYAGIRSYVADNSIDPVFTRGEDLTDSTPKAPDYPDAW